MTEESSGTEELRLCSLWKTQWLYSVPILLGLYLWEHQLASFLPPSCLESDFSTLSSSHSERLSSMLPLCSRGPFVDSCIQVFLSFPLSPEWLPIFNIFACLWPCTWGCHLNPTGHSFKFWECLWPQPLGLKPFFWTLSLKSFSFHLRHCAFLTAQWIKAVYETSHIHFSSSLSVPYIWLM